MAASAEPLTLRLNQRVRAARARVFDLLTVPQELGRWWGPRGFTTPDVSIDLRVGGDYRFTMQPPDGPAFHLAGQFVEIDPPSRLIYTFAWEEPDPDDRTTLVQLSLEEHADVTAIVLSQGVFATRARLELHRDGWTDSLEKLTALAESAP